MKKTAFLFALLFLLTGCAKEPDDRLQTASPSVSVSAEAYFQIHASSVRLYATEKGFLVLSPGERESVCSWFSPEEKKLAENVFTCPGLCDSLLVCETEPGKAVVAANSSVFYTAFEENAAVEYALGEGVFAAGALYRRSAFLCRKSDLLLLVPLDLSETFVLQDVRNLPDFAALLFTSPDGKSVWYATGEKGAYTGVAGFQYGSTALLQGQKIAFFDWKTYGKTDLVLAKNEEKGTDFIVFSPENGEVLTVFYPKTSADFAVCREKSLLAVSAAGENRIDFYSLDSGEAIASLELAENCRAASLAFSESGDTLAFALQKEGESDVVLSGAAIGFAG